METENLIHKNNEDPFDYKHGMLNMKY